MVLIERTAYPRPGGRPAEAELASLYTPTRREVVLARSATRGEGSMLGFLVMLKSFQRLGYFPRPEDVPEAVVSHIRSRLWLPAEEAAPDAPRRSRQRHRDHIREHLGVRAYGEDARRLATQAVADAALTMDDPADLVNVAIEELVKERYELPAFSTLDRLARHVKYAVNARLFTRLDGGIVKSCGSILDHAASFSSSFPSTNSPSTNFAPALTNATK